MRQVALRLLLVLAAVMASVGPGHADRGRHRVADDGVQAVATVHHVAGQDLHGGHADGCGAPAAGGSQGVSDMVPGHCQSPLMSCGTGVAGPLPAPVDCPARLRVRILSWHAPDDVSSARPVPPHLRPPRLSS